MRTWIAAIVWTVLAGTAAAAAGAPAQPSSDEQRALRAQLEERYDIVPLSDGVALTPKTRRADVRLIEISDAIAVNGIVVTGRELRERVGADADAILRVSYLNQAARRALFAPRPDPVPRSGTARPAAPDDERWMRRAGGDRVRVFGDVRVREEERIDGQVVAVLGSARIDGEVGDQVVAVLGSVDLGPRAVVRGDIVSVGGRVRRATGAEVRGAVTEVSLSDAGARLHIGPLMGGLSLFDGFDGVPRLLASAFRLGLLLLMTSFVLVVARATVEASAHRVSDDPVQSTLVGITVGILAIPVLFVTGLILAVSVIGIPLLLLMPFAVLFLIVLAIVGFSGTAFAIGQGARRRFGWSSPAGVLDVCMGVVLILLPLLAGRAMALGGWLAGPLSFLLIGAGLGLEFLAWSAGFGAVLTNAFGRWRARRRLRATPAPATGN